MIHPDCYFFETCFGNDTAKELALKQGFGQLFTFAMTDVQVAAFKLSRCAPYRLQTSTFITTPRHMSICHYAHWKQIRFDLQVVTWASGFGRIGSMIGSWRQSVYQV